MLPSDVCRVSAFALSRALGDSPDPPKPSSQGSMRGVLLDNITRQLSSWEDGEMGGPWSLRGSPTSSELRNCRFKQLKPQELMSFLKGEYSSNYWSHSKYTLPGNHMDPQTEFRAVVLSCSSKWVLRNNQCCLQAVTPKPWPRRL